MSSPPAHPPPVPIDLVLRLQALARALSGRVLQELDAEGVRESDGYLFQHLVPGPLPVTVLAERLGVTQQAASKAVADLERRRLVVRQPDPDDGRVRLVSLSERGWQAVEGARAARQAMSSEISALLGSRGTACFESDLTVVLDHFGGLEALLSRRLRSPD